MIVSVVLQLFVVLPLYDGIFSVPFVSWPFHLGTPLFVQSLIHIASASSALIMLISQKLISEKDFVFYINIPLRYTSLFFFSSLDCTNSSLIHIQ